MTVKDLLDKLGVEYREKANRYECLCPFHADSNPSSGFYKDTSLFHCYACPITVDMVGFYQKVRGIGYAQALYDMEKMGFKVAEKDPQDCLSELTAGVQRIKAEKALALAKGRLDYKRHARFGETLDILFLRAEKGRLKEERFFELLMQWYMKLEVADVVKEKAE